MTRAITASTLTPLINSPRLPLIAALAVKVALVVTIWHARKRSRRALAGLNDSQLLDIGVTRREALIEAERPFWKG